MLVDIDIRVFCEYSTLSGTAEPLVLDSPLPSNIIGRTLQMEPVNNDLAAEYMFYSNECSCLDLLEKAAESDFLGELYGQLRRFFPFSVFVIEQFINPEEEQEQPSFVISITRSEQSEESPYALLAQFCDEWWFENRYRAPFFTVLIDG